jgi:hypothetical protein
MFGMVPLVLSGLGTDQHYKYLEQIYDRKVINCKLFLEVPMRLA